MIRDFVLRFSCCSSIVFMAITGSYAAGGGVKNSVHNLTAAVAGEPMARICIFCHTPHSADPIAPLWNHELPTMVYTPYSSSTMGSTPGQPTGSSKVCLSCHDGTIALGRLFRSTLPGAGGKIKGRANLTTDLSDDHPISFDYTRNLAAENSELADPTTLKSAGVKLDNHGQLQCTTCHDPHGTEFPQFLVADNAFSGLCIICHIKDGWQASSHATSTATWNGSGTDPWPHSDMETVAENGCESCHTSHQAGRPERLLNFFNEEDNCLVCHGGNAAGKNIEVDLQKAYTHSVSSYLQIHDPDEDALTMPRHVECQDCHNPHMASAGSAPAPGISPVQAGVRGITDAGARVDQADYEYETCFSCHSDNANVPPPVISRQILQPNIRLKFNLSNPSSHPVVGPGHNPDVPSLILPWTETSLVKCTDCHASDSGPGAGGGGAAGPHGSVWPFLLEREYRTADKSMESYQSYAMCYKCHDRESILNDETFKGHKLHVVDQRTPCSVCHDPHGISSTQGTEMNNTHLINFDTTLVTPEPAGGRLEFEDLGRLSGRCFLTCHGEIHAPESYGP
jgi:predicted CXXCH cytochrome family protein